MGEVYSATDPRLGRTVAVKVLPARLAADADALVRFEHEARTVAALNHPNIVTIHSVEEADGVHFMTMELVDGQSLERLLAEQTVSLDQFFEIIVPLADALAAAHGRGITHRDLKPANVMVTETGRVKVLDFGLAKLFGSDAELAETVTRGLTGDGLVLGTVPYMSPEQVEARTVDHRSDIFSLGVLMYELASGRRPFEGDSAAGLMSSILRDTPSSVSGLRAGIPASVERVIERCLAKAPAERYQTSAEVRDAVESAKRERESGGLAEAEDAEKSIAVLAFTNMSADPENEFFSDGISEEIINALGQIDGLRVAARTSAFSFKGKNVDLRDVAEQLGVATVLEGSVRKAGTRLRITTQLVNAADGYQLWSERYDRELEDVFELQDEIARTIAHRLEVALSGEQQSAIVEPATDSIEAYELYLKGRALLYKRGGYIPQGLACFEQAVALDPGYALAWAGLADAHGVMALYGFVPSEDGTRRAKEAAVQAVALDDGLAEAHSALGCALLFDFDIAAAEREFERALTMNPNFVQGLAFYALLVLAMCRGRFDEALEHATRMRTVDPLSGYAAAIHGLVLITAGRHEEAVPHVLFAIERDPELFVGYWALQNSYSLSGRHAEAVAAGHAALAVSNRHAWTLMGNGGIHLTAPGGRIAVCLGPECTTRGTTPRCVHGFPTMPRVGTIWTGCAGLRVSDARPVTVRRAGSWAAESAVVRTVVGGCPAQPAPSSRTLARRSPCGSPQPGH